MMIRQPGCRDCSEDGAERKNSVHDTKERALRMVEVCEYQELAIIKLQNKATNNSAIDRLPGCHS